MTSFRRRVAAVGVGLSFALVVPTAAQADSYPPVTKPVSCSAKAVSGASKIYVNMGPNLRGSRYYNFRIDILRGGEWFRYLKWYRTKGKGETRTVNMPKGTYRIHCYGKYGRSDNNSRTVYLRR